MSAISKTLYKACSIQDSIPFFYMGIMKFILMFITCFQCHLRIRNFVFESLILSFLLYYIKKRI